MYRNIKIFALMFLGFLLMVFIHKSLEIYLIQIDVNANKILNGTDISYTSIRDEIEDDGFTSIDIEKTLNNKIKTKKIDSLTYKIESEKFYFNIDVHHNDDGKDYYEITKIFDDNHNVYAKMNFKYIQEIKYQSDNNLGVTVLKFIAQNNSSYLIITDDNYYFIGEDLDEIKYEDGEFYYYTYNKNYLPLKNQEECNDDSLSQIHDYEPYDLFYVKGKINFFDNFYQKIEIKSEIVKNFCNTLVHIN